MKAAFREEAPPDEVFSDGNLTEPTPTKAFEVEKEISTESQPRVMITKQDTLTGDVETTVLTETYQRKESSGHTLWQGTEVSSVAYSIPPGADLNSQATLPMHVESELTTSQPMVPESTVKVDPLNHLTTTETSACRRMNIKFLYCHIGASTVFCSTVASDYCLVAD